MIKPNSIVFDVGGVLLDWLTSSQAVADYLGVSKIKLFDTLFDQTVTVSIGVQMNVGELSTSEGWRLFVMIVPLGSPWWMSFGTIAPTIQRLTHCDRISSRQYLKT